MTLHRLMGDSPRDVMLIADESAAMPNDDAACDPDIRVSAPPRQQVWRRYLVRLLRWWPDD